MSGSLSPPVAPQPLQPLSGGAPPGLPGAAGGVPMLAALARRQAPPQDGAPGQGANAEALMQVKTAIDMIQRAIPNLPTGSEVHRDALQAVQRLARHMPQGIPTAGTQQTMIQDLLRNVMRNAVMQRVLAARGNAAPSPLAPSTPLPGA